MATIHLIEGPVGAGKTTFAARLGVERSAPTLDLDEWMVILFRPDRPATDFMAWYAERKRRCIEQIWRVTRALIDSGTDVVLELGLVRRLDREELYQRVDVEGYELAVYLIDAPEDLRRDRVRARNRDRGSTFKMPVSDEVFELANNLWEAPDERECRERRVRIVAHR